jgi:hypothetical protein
MNFNLAIEHVYIYFQKKLLPETNLQI